MKFSKKINRDKTRAVIVKEIQDLRPYIYTHEDMGIKCVGLWTLYNALNGNDEGVRFIAERTRLVDFVKFESVG